MNEEEKKAIEYYQNKEVSFSVDFDTEKLLRVLGITEEDSFENHQIRFKTLLNLIEKLQKENEKYKRLAEINLKSAEEFKNNMCEHRCLLKNENEELKSKNKTLEELLQGNLYELRTCKCCSCKNKECSVAQCKEECASIREAERKEHCSCGYIYMCSGYKEDFTAWLINREDSIE